MRTVRLSCLVGALVLAAAAAFSQQPRSGAESSRPSQQPPQPPGVTGDVEHGRYLVQQVAMCFECHSPRDGQGNIPAGEMFTGGPIPFRPPWPNDWAIRAPRIRGLPGYTDADGLRLLTQGAIGRTGAQLRLPMPRFRMTPQDAADVVAFLKSLD